MRPRDQSAGMITVEVTTDASLALERAGDLFRAEPELCNMVASALVPEMERSAIIVLDGSRPAAAAIAWDKGYTLTPFRLHGDSQRTAHSAMAEVLPANVERLMGPASAALGVAGAWSERMGGGFEPISVFRIYRLGQLVVPPGSDAGVLHVVGESEVERETAWGVSFGEDTGLTIESDESEAIVRRAVGDGRLFAWRVDGVPVSRLLVSVERFGVVRIGGVYTPPEHRGSGHAAALTARVSEHILGRPEVTSVTLNTQAINPMTNRLYRRLGYEAIGENLNLALTT